MNYTDAEKKKIAENLDKIVEYINKEICPYLREPVYADISTRGSITVCPADGYDKTVSGRTGNNLTINFEHEDTRGLYYSSSSVYSLDSVVIAQYATDLILNWQTIKEFLNQEIIDQNVIIDAIYEFQV